MHTGNDAAFAAASIGAQAFTCGRDIFFGAGRYAPESADGRALLLHELVHVAQNARTPQSSQVIRRIRLVPRPTSASKTLIHDTIQEAIDPKRGLAGSIAMVVSSNLQSLLDTLVDLKKLRLKAP